MNKLFDYKFNFNEAPPNNEKILTIKKNINKLYNIVKFSILFIVIITILHCATFNEDNLLVDSFSTSLVLLFNISKADALFSIFLIPIFVFSLIITVLFTMLYYAYNQINKFKNVTTEYYLERFISFKSENIYFKSYINSINYDRNLVMGEYYLMDRILSDDLHKILDLKNNREYDALCDNLYEIR